MTCNPRPATCDLQPATCKLNPPGLLCDPELHFGHVLFYLHPLLLMMASFALKCAIAENYLASHLNLIKRQNNTLYHASLLQKLN